MDSSRLRYWKWRLGKAGVSADSALPAPEVTSVEVPFVEVTPPARNLIGDEPIEIVAPSGLRVRVPARLGEDALRRILRQVT